MNGSKVVSKLLTYSGASIIPSNFGAGPFMLIDPQTCYLDRMLRSLICGKTVDGKTMITALAIIDKHKRIT